MLTANSPAVKDQGDKNMICCEYRSNIKRRDGGGVKPMKISNRHRDDFNFALIPNAKN